MNTLLAYVADKNRQRSVFGEQPLNMADPADRKYVAACIENELSPENLTCDGELPRAEVNKRLRLLTNAQSELEAYEDAGQNRT